MPSLSCTWMTRQQNNAFKLQRFPETIDDFAMCCGENISAEGSCRLNAFWLFLQHFAWEDSSYYTNIRQIMPLKSYIRKALLLFL